MYNQSSIETLFDKSMPSKTETQERSFCLRRDWCRDMQWLHVYRLQTFLENPVGKYMEHAFFGSFQQKISGSNGTSEKVVLFFRTEYSNRKFVFHFFQAFSLIPVSALRGRFPVNRTDLICTNGKRDSGTKLTSPEFLRTICLNRGPIDRSAHANGKQPMWMRSSRQGTAIICETKCISF